MAPTASHPGRFALLLRLLVIAGATVLFAAGARAGGTIISSTWLGNNANWSDATQWSPNAFFPNNGNGGNTFNVTIGSGTANLTQAITISNLIFSGGTITGAFTLATTGSASVISGGTISSAIANSGTLALTDGTLLSGGGSLANTGTISSAGAVSIGISVSSSGTLTGSGTLIFQAGLNLTGGSIQNSGGVELEGTSTWSGGDMNSSGTTTIASGATLNLIGGNDSAFDQRVIVNHGTINWQAGNLFSDNGGSLTNAAGAAFIDSGTGSVAIENDLGDDSIAFGNAGTYSKTATGSTAIIVPFNNTGTLSVSAGSLELLGGGANSATFSVAAGATLVFAGDYTLTNGSTLIGTGAYSLVGGTLTANVTVDTPQSQFSLTGGVLAGTQTFTGTVNWSAGTSLRTSGTTTIASGATLNLADDNNYAFDQRTIVNRGMINWQAGNLFTDSNGSLINTPGAAFNDSATDSGEILNDSNDGTVTFVNAGLYAKTGTGSTNIIVPFNNTGTVSDSAGLLELSGGGVNSSTFSVATGASFVIEADYTLTNGSTLAGTGKYSLLAGTLTAGGIVDTPQTQFFLTGGTLAGTQTFAGTMVWNGGSMDSAGTTNIASGGTLNITADINGNASPHDYDGHGLVNFGTVGWSAGAGPIESGHGGSIVNNGIWNDTASDVLNNDFGGTTAVFTNSGTYNKSGAGTTDIQIPFSNTGTVSVSAGTLELDGAVTQASGSTLTGGTWIVADNSSLVFPGGTAFTTNQGNVTLNGTNSAFTAIASLTANQGTIFLLGGRAFPVASGFSDDGSLTVSGANSALSVAGTLAIGNSATGSLTISNGGTVSVGGVVILAQNSGSIGILRLNSSGTLQIGGANGLQAGAGTSTFSWNGGTVQVSGSDLTTSVSATLGAGTNSTLDTNGLNATWSGVIAGGGAFAKIGGGTLALTGANTLTGGTTVNAGTLILGGNGTLGDTANPLTVNGGTLDLGGSTQLVGTVTLAGGTIADGTLTSTATFALQSGTASAALAGGDGLTKTTTLAAVLAGANTYTGETTIDEGVLTLSDDGDLGNTANPLTVNGGTLDLGTTSQTVGAMTMAGGTITNGSLIGASYVLQNGTVGAVLAGFANLTMSGGVATISGANTYTGTNTVNSGVLLIDGAGTLGNTANSLAANGGTLDLGTTSQTAGAVTVAGGTVANGTLNATSVAVASGTVSAVLAGAAALSKTGAGTVSLSAANTYTGSTTIAAGTLAVNGSTSSGSAVAVNGGTLAGSGTVGGAVTVASGAAISPGNSPGTLTLGGGLTLNGGSVLNFELTGAAQDQLILVGGGANTLAGPGSGTVTVNLIDLDGSVPLNTTYTLVSVVGSFASVGDWTVGSFTLEAPAEWALSSLSMSGDNLLLFVVPEPSVTSLLAGLAALGIAWCIRRRAK